jgi:hypothetical protein
MGQVILQAMKERLGHAVVAEVLKQAAEQYKLEHSDLPRNFDAKYLARDVLRRMDNGFAFADAPRSGRRTQASEDQIRQFTDLFLQGSGGEGDKWWGYTSLHHSLQESDRLQEMFEEIGLSESRLWARMSDAHGRRLNQISIISRYQLDEAQKQSRKDCAADWLEKGMDWLMNVVWIDEKVEWLTPHHIYRCYAPDSWRSFSRRGETPFKCREKVKYEAAVSAWTGALFFSFVGGTSGRQQIWPVRTIVPAWRHQHPAFIVSAAPCLV